MLSFSNILDLTPMFLATIMGIVVYRKLTLFYRILLVQVSVFIVFDLYAASIRPQNNAWVFNISMIMEIGLVLIAAMTYFKTKNSRLIISVLFLIFIVIFSIDIYNQKPEDLATNAYLTGGISITGVYLFLLFYHFFEKKDSYQTFALTITCLGVVLYFACITPYLSMMSHLQTQNPDENKSLFNIIIGSLGQFRYFLITVAFFMHWRSFQFKSPY